MEAGILDRPGSIRAALVLERLTIGWMSVELVVGVVTALASGSPALMAFGLDSAIEILSAVVLLWRIRIEAHGAGDGRVEEVERRSAGIIGALLLLLAVYVVISSGLALFGGTRPEDSLPGIFLALASLVVMPLLVRSKRAIAGRIRSSALLADAACGVVCAYMALVLLVGLFLREAFGWWWADPVAALGIVWFIVREAREGIETYLGREGTC